MSYKKYTMLANPNNYGKKRNKSSIKYLIYHYTSNKTDKAKSNANYFKNNIVKASSHYFTDENDIYQSVPDLITAYAVGGSKYSDCTVTGGGTMYGKITNTNSISIEMCSTNGEIAEKTMENAISLGKELMKLYNIPISNVYRHFDVNGKHCPGWYGWYGHDSSKWMAFKNRLAISLTDATDTNTTQKPSSVTYTHKDFVKEVQAAIGAKTDGIPGPETLSKTVTVSKIKNNRHGVIKPIQKYLNSIGYNCGVADGIAGSKFDNAVKSFQKTNKCMTDGEITAKMNTWKKLLKLS